MNSADRFDMTRCCGFGLVFLAVVAAAGCGKKRQNVTGLVTLDDKPLISGVIQFHGSGDRLSVATIQSDGTFVATDLLPGDEVRVAVMEDPDKAMNQLRSAPAGDLATPPLDGELAVPAKSVPIPAKYKFPQTSGLSYTIDPSTSRLEVKLQSK